MSYADRLRKKFAPMAEWTRRCLPGDTGDDDARVKVYVDGSFDQASRFAGWGWVATRSGVELAWGCGKKSDTYGSRNITGECAAAISALRWAESEGLDEVVVVHDYLGLGKWGDGSWSARRPVAMDYQHALSKIALRIEFRWIRGHQGSRYNEMADALAEKGKRESGIVRAGDAEQWRLSRPNIKEGI